MSSIEQFNQSRISFAIINHKLTHTIFDKRDHKDWLAELYDIKGKDFENTIRGYMKDDKVYFYKSSKFEPVDLRTVGNDALNHIQILSMVYMNASNPECFNGLNVGQAGETWEPLIALGRLNSVIEQRFRSYGVVKEAY